MGFNIQKRDPLVRLRSLSAAELYGLQLADRQVRAPHIQIDTIMKHIVNPRLREINKRLQRDLC